ncbi:MAG: lysophospholipase [Rhodobacteraceae bacterium]|nr:lysophospholipase [Paracoccaceae bacterium]
MRKLGRFLGRALAVLVVVGVTLWQFGPYEDVDLAPSFDPGKFDDAVQTYFETIESKVDDIVPGTEKRVIWADGFTGKRTAISVLYVHGFSATSEEIRPVPDRIAAALGANLVYTRLQGHGVPGAALGRASASTWMVEMAEGLAAARMVGDRVVVISTSTGGTLAAAAALNPQMSDKVAAMIFVSPNFGLNNGAAFLMTWPGAKYWLPVVLGGEYRSTSDNPARAGYWSNPYPYTALMPMGALVKKVTALDFSQATIPALFWFSEGDKVVRPDLTRKVAGKWGGPSDIQTVEMGPGDDPHSHVIAGDIMSPGQTSGAVSGMLEWLAKQGVE